MQTKIEIVSFGKNEDNDTLFAIRKTTGRFFKSYKYLDLDGMGKWREKTDRFFRDCLTVDLSKVKRLFIVYNDSVGVPYYGETHELNLNELDTINRLINKGDAGLKDLTQQIKSYLILKGE